MSIIVELSIPVDRFDLGRRLDIPDDGQVKLEPIVPLGEDFVPLLWLYASSPEVFEEGLRTDGGVKNVRRLLESDGVILYGVEWTDPPDDFFAVLRANGGSILTGNGDTDQWQFELRFPDNDALSAFKQACDRSDLPTDVRRVYDEREPEEPTEPVYGLTGPQREALLLAVRNGYYDIPRRETTVELAEELGISDQAVTERLRRAITTLVQNSLLGRDTDE
jgi:hypothetical protein